MHLHKSLRRVILLAALLIMAFCCAANAEIGMINGKTTAVRLIPAYGKKAGETVEFGGLLGYAPIMPLNTNSSADFVLRGGRIPAPIHSLRN